MGLEFADMFSEDNFFTKLFWKVWKIGVKIWYSFLYFLKKDSSPKKSGNFFRLYDLIVFNLFSGMEPKEPNQGQMEEINLKPVPNAEVTLREFFFIFVLY